MTGYELQYISTTNGAFDSVLAANMTSTSVIESKFLITSSYNGRPVYFGVDYADTCVRAYEKDMYMCSLSNVSISSYLTLNEEHTAYFSPTEYRWNGSKIADVTGTVAIPSSPRFRSQIRGNFYCFKITDNGVDIVNLVAWDEDGTLGIKDLVSGNFYTPSTGTWTAGPIAHVFEPSKSSLTFPASGGSLTFDVEAETTWTASTPTFATLSPSTGGTGTTTVTATCPSYTGTTKREETITFTDNDNYTFDFKIRQRALTNGISNLYLGDNQIPTANAIYLGDAGVNTIYLGEEIVYSSGPFVGLKASPNTLDFTNSNNTANMSIRSSEDWTITDDSGGWLSYSTTTGSTGKTVVSVTASTTQVDRTATITVTTANYSATIDVTDKALIMPLNEVWYKTVSNASLPLRSGTYYIDSNGNQLTYTESFDSVSGLWKMTFNGNVYGNNGALYYHNYSDDRLVELWLPYGYVRPNDIFIYGQRKFEKFKGDSPAIVDNGNAVVCLVQDSTNMKDFVIQGVKSGATTITIPEGVVGLCSYSFRSVKVTTLNLPSTLANIYAYSFESSQITTMNCYATTCPNVYSNAFYFVNNSGTLHYPAGSDYSSFYVPGSWTKVGDL